MSGEPGVRCEAHTLAGDAAWLARFLRGFSALYGGGFSFRAAAHESQARLSQARAALEALERVNAPASAAELFAAVSVAGERAMLVFGRAALAAWLRENAFEPRYRQSPAVEKQMAEAAAPVRIFVSGDRSQVGKSTVCLGLVGALLRSGFQPGEIGYIKPATQCEKPQLIAKFCRQHGVDCCDIGPILFYSGFTREFLKGNTETSAELLARAKAKVDEIGRGKKVLVVDGVGYPAVGSICGVSNADVAATVQAPVVLVGKKGVGDAVDSFNLNACFFESKGVKVLGAIFNRLPLDGFYSLENCRASVTEYFSQCQPDKTVYGFIPELAALTDESTSQTTEAAADGSVGFITSAESALAQAVIDSFSASVDLKALLADAESFFESSTKERAIAATSLKGAGKRSAPQATSPAGPVKKSRQEIQAAAKAAGAEGG